VHFRDSRRQAPDSLSHRPYALDVGHEKADRRVPVCGRPVIDRCVIIIGRGCRGGTAVVVIVVVFIIIAHASGDAAAWRSGGSRSRAPAVPGHRF
jgi:hypothetical protein